MLTKTRVLLTDLLMGGFCPLETSDLMDGKALDIPLARLSWSERKGEKGVLAEDAEERTGFLGDEVGREEDDFTTGLSTSSGEDNVA